MNQFVFAFLLSVFHTELSNRTYPTDQDPKYPFRSVPEPTPTTMHTITTLHSVDTEYSADSVEWCPYDGQRDYFVCATYQLEERTAAQPDVPAKRKGRLYLFRYDRNIDVLQQCDSHDTAALLDLKWTRRGTEAPIVAAATALGEVVLYSLVNGKLESCGSVHLNPDADNLLTLAIEWSSTAGTETSDHHLVASDSHGKLSLLHLTETGTLDVVSSWDAHSFEAWTCAWDRSNSGRVYSGGDDMMLHVFDTRCSNAKVLTNRSHGAGVTALLSFGADSEHMLATGSYDEQLRIFDTRKMRAPVSEVALGGGIWRIKRCPQRPDWLLCANMYHNFSVVQVADGFAEMEVVGEYFEHKSICYGADWRVEEENERDGDAPREHLMATCSFYDHKLCVAKITENKE